MPALPVIPGVIRIQWNFKIGEDLTAKCRRFYSYTGTAPTIAQLNAMALTVNNDSNTQFIPLMQASRTLDIVTITDMASATGAVGQSEVNGLGTRAGQGNPASAAVLISSEIARRYRGGHPRDYWPFGSSNDLNDAQTWDSALLTQVSDNWNTLNGQIDGAGWSGAGSIAPVNVSQYAGFTVHDGTTGRARNVSTPRTSPIIDAIVSFVVQAGIAQIRKRLLRLA